MDPVVRGDLKPEQQIINSRWYCPKPVLCVWLKQKMLHRMLVPLSSDLLLSVLIVASLYVSYVQAQQGVPAEEGKLLFAHVVSDSMDVVYRTGDSQYVHSRSIVMAIEPRSTPIRTIHGRIPATGVLDGDS